ncbi:MAG TPA: hypothetical protein VFZ97_15790 [Acidimicrobiales bacterium]
MIAGLVVRILELRSSWGVPDADEATGMVMAQRAAHGHLAIFFWGGNYGGDVVTWLEALLVNLFGLHVVIFQVVDTALAFVVVLLLRSVSRRFLSPTAADLSAGLVWVLSPAWVFWSSREYVFWVPGMVFALATIWACLRWREEPRGVAPYLVGFFAGVTYWIYPLYGCLLAVPLIAYIWSARSDWRSIVKTLVMIPVGGVFWLVANFRHHFESLHRPVNAHQGLGYAVRHSVTEILPRAYGTYPRPSGLSFPPVAPGSGALRVIGISLFAGGVVWTLGFLIVRRPLLTTAGAAVVLWVPLLAISGVFLDSSGYRYSLVLIPALAFMVAWLADRHRYVVLAVAILAVATSIVTVGSGTKWFRSQPACPGDLQAVGRYLQGVGRDRVWASYWISAPLDVCTRDRVVASPTAVERDDYAKKVVGAAPQATFVVYPGNVLDQALGLWESRNPGAGASRVVVGGLAIWSLQQPATPQSLDLPPSVL